MWCYVSSSLPVLVFLFCSLLLRSVLFSSLLFSSLSSLLFSGSSLLRLFSSLLFSPFLSSPLHAPLSSPLTLRSFSCSYSCSSSSSSSFVLAFKVQIKTDSTNQSLVKGLWSYADNEIECTDHAVLGDLRQNSLKSNFSRESLGLINMSLEFWKAYFLNYDIN